MEPGDEAVCVCVCVCYSTFHYSCDYSRHKQTYLELSDFHWKCFIAELERFLYGYNKLAFFYSWKMCICMKLDHVASSHFVLISERCSVGVPTSLSYIYIYWPLAVTEYMYACSVASPGVLLLGHSTFPTVTVSATVCMHWMLCFFICMGDFNFNCPCI